MSQQAVNPMALIANLDQYIDARVNAALDARLAELEASAKAAPVNPEDLLTTAEAAVYLNRSNEYIRQLARTGQLPSHRNVTGHRLLFLRADLDAHRRTPSSSARAATAATRYLSTHS